MLCPHTQHVSFTLLEKKKKKYLVTCSHLRPPALTQEVSFSLSPSNAHAPFFLAQPGKVLSLAQQELRFFNTALTYKHLSKKNTTLLPVSVAFIYYWLADNRNAGNNGARQCRDNRSKSGLFFFYFIFIFFLFFFKCRKIFLSDFFFTFHESYLHRFPR